MHVCPGGIMRLEADQDQDKLDKKQDAEDDGDKPKHLVRSG